MTVERQVRQLVRAWPYPDRRERGDEIVGTTLDLVPEGSKRLPFALAINLVFGGLQARWRARPPFWRWIYYVMGGRLPLMWHRWMLNDLLGPGWRLRWVRRRVFITITSIGLAQWATYAVFGPLEAQKGVPSPAIPTASPWYWLIIFGAVSLVGVPLGALSARRQRDRMLARNGYLTPPYYNVPPAKASSPTRPSQP